MDIFHTAWNYVQKNHPFKNTGYLRDAGSPSYRLENARGRRRLFPSLEGDQTPVYRRLS